MYICNMMDSNMCVTLTETTNNTKYEVTLPWRSFTLWQKVMFGRTEYELRVKEEKDCVSAWYEADCQEPMLRVLCYTCNDCISDFRLRPFDKEGGMVTYVADKGFESKLLCMEKLYDRLVSEYRDIFCVIE